MDCTSTLLIVPARKCPFGNSRPYLVTGSDLPVLVLYSSRLGHNRLARARVGHECLAKFSCRLPTTAHAVDMIHPLRTCDTETSLFLIGPCFGTRIECVSD
jgi:hypothetical protein